MIIIDILDQDSTVFQIIVTLEVDLPHFPLLLPGPPELELVEHQQEQSLELLLRLNTMRI